LEVSSTFLPQLFPLKGKKESDLQQQLAALEIALDTAIELPILAQQFYTSYQEKQGDYCIF